MAWLARLWRLRSQSHRSHTVEAPAHEASSGERAAAYSVAMATGVAEQLHAHLARSDGQEDICFALYQTSRGRRRTSALLFEVVLPDEGDRQVHGNASFNGTYFLRAAALAAERGVGVALLHSHPGGKGWQGLSADDHKAELNHAAQAVILTGLPLVGLTYATSSRSFSGRFWIRSETRAADGSARTAGGYQVTWCESVRVVGTTMRASHNPTLRPPGNDPIRQRRTLNAWGDSAHADLTRLRVGVIGAGSTGMLLAEGLARTGFLDVVAIDFDTVKEHNLDRLLHATNEDAAEGALKIDVLVRAAKQAATGIGARFRGVPTSLVSADGWGEALDCDVLLSCVDRPWPRFALNIAAYAHLIPVVDAGIAVDAPDGLRGAEWRAHTAAPGRRCLECLGAYDPGHVQVERDGLLDDPRYIEGLPRDSPLRQSENVFAFSLGAASLQLLELLRLVLAPSRVSDIGASLYHWTTGTIDRDERDCEPACPFAGMVGQGDAAHDPTVR